MADQLEGTLSAENDLPAPSNVRAIVLSHCSVEVTWDELFDATEYVISYSTTKEHITCGNVIVKGANTTRYTFNNLEENTPYIITVQATASDSRKSAVSSELSLVTHATVPSSPPQSIVITSTNPASLNVSWQPPLEKFCTIPITGYKIEYFKDEPQDTVKDIKNVNIASGTTHTISGLIPCAKYSVQVAAMNGNRTGPFSEPVVEILEDVPSEPCSLEIDLVTSTTMNLQWMPPKTPNGVITQYSIQYGETVIDNFGSKTSNKLMGTVEGLSPNTTYTLQLRAHTKVGPGPPSNLTVKTCHKEQIWSTCGSWKQIILAIIVLVGAILYGLWLYHYDNTR